MNVTAYAFTFSDDKVNAFPDDYAKSIFLNACKYASAPTQIVAHRSDRLMYYIYLQRSEAKSTDYAGLCIVYNDAYATDFGDMIDMFEFVFTRFLKSKEAFHTFPNGGWKVNNSDALSTANQPVTNTLTNLMQGLHGFKAGLPPTNYDTGHRVVSHKLNDDLQRIVDSTIESQYTFITITSQTAAPKPKVERVKPQKETSKTTIAIVIFVLVFFIGAAIAAVCIQSSENHVKTESTQTATTTQKPASKEASTDKLPTVSDVNISACYGTTLVEYAPIKTSTMQNGAQIDAQVTFQSDNTKTIDLRVVIKGDYGVYDDHSFGKITINQGTDTKTLCSGQKLYLSAGQYKYNIYANDILIKTHYFRVIKYSNADTNNNSQTSNNSKRSSNSTTNSTSSSNYSSSRSSVPQISSDMIEGCDIQTWDGNALKGLPIRESSMSNGEWICGNLKIRTTQRGNCTLRFQIENENTQRIHEDYRFEININNNYTETLVYSRASANLPKGGYYFNIMQNDKIIRRFYFRVDASPNSSSTSDNYQSSNSSNHLDTDYPKVDRIPENNRGLKITRIHRTATYTIIELVYDNRYTHSARISIDPETFIRDCDTDKKYSLVRAEGIPMSPNEYSLSSYSEKVRFKLIFTAVPSSCRRINLIENLGSPWQFYGIHLKD